MIGIQAARSDGTRTVLVKKIGYDEYGQRTYLEYGNGNITTYTYDEQRRWMDTLKTQNTRSGVTLQNLTYRFDNVGNVLSRGEVTSRYSTSQIYTYDALYQLTGAQGSYTERPAGIDDWRQEYSQNFSYDALGNITQKISTQTRLPQSSGALNLNYSIKITPENQENYKDDKRFKDNIDTAGNRYATLGAACAKGKLLVSNINRDTDINKPKVETITLDLKGQDEDAVIADLFEADANYQDNAEYKLFAKKEDEGPGHNSNSYVSGLLEAVGLDPPDMKSNTPGYDKPLPDINFYRDSWMPPNNEEE